MYEQEKQRAIHLMILLYNTIFIIALIIGAAYLKMEMWTSILFLAGLVTCWIMHIADKLSETARLWIYVILSMLAFAFYGVYEMGLYDLTCVMMMLILICTVTEERAFVRFCAVVYYPTMCYKIWITYEDPLRLPAETVIRIFLHFAVIFIGERLAETILQRRLKERKKSDERISRLEEANRRAEDFLTNVSHELRTPINAVTGITAVMLKNEEDPENRKDLLAIQMAGNRLFRQIEDILDYTEIDTGRITVSEENYMLPSLVNDIIIEHRLTRRDNKAELLFDMDTDIPSVLLGDGKKIKKIIQHLIDNAIKFTKKGGVYVRIYAIHKPYGINLCIRVSDTGIGIAEEEMEKITERFFQSSGGRNRKAGGLGLGIPIVYGLVTAMEGFVRLESEVGSGTTVSVSIPQKIVDFAPSMEVRGRAELCIALYIKPEKYEVPEIRDYYNATISHMVQKLDLILHRVFTQEELEKLVAMYRLTHLVIGREEYEEDRSYYETLDRSIEVIVVADDSFHPTADSRVKLVRKPFYCLPIVNYLNAQTSLEDDVVEKEDMICPGVKVLVVDDEPMNLMVAEGIFKAYQMEVKTAESGMAAIELCREEEFDLIFLDHMMPEMDGVETLKVIRKNRRDTEKACTFIAFTANAVSGAKEMFLQQGFDEFISKPIEDQELRRLLRKVLPKTSIAYADAYAEENDRKRTSVKEQGGGTDPSAAEQEGVQKPLTEDNPEKGEMDRLKEQGFHTEAGLRYCRGSNEFYKEVLVMFARDAGRKQADIEKFFQNGDLKNYEIMVHGLKSSSKMIGAGMLSQLARHLEEAAKSQDADYVRANHEELMVKYRETVQCILDVFDQEEGASGKDAFTVQNGDPGNGNLGIKVSRDEFLRHLSELKRSLDTFEANAAETLLTEMSGFVYQGTPVNELLRDVRQNVEDFDLSTASEMVETLMGSVEGGGAR